MGRVRPLLGAGRHIQQAHAPPTKVQTLHRAVDWQPSPFPSPRLSDHVLHLQAPPPASLTCPTMSSTEVNVFSMISPLTCKKEGTHRGGRDAMWQRPVQREGGGGETRQPLHIIHSPRQLLPAAAHQHHRHLSMGGKPIYPPGLHARISVISPTSYMYPSNLRPSGPLKLDAPSLPMAHAPFRLPAPPPSPTHPPLPMMVHASLCLPTPPLSSFQPCPGMPPQGG